MKTFEMNLTNYHALRMRFAGLVFHRIDETGRYLMKPLKCVEHAVRIMSIREIINPQQATL